MQRRKRIHMISVILACMMMLESPAVSMAAVQPEKSESVVMTSAAAAGTASKTSGKVRMVILAASGGVVKKKASADGTVVLPPDKNGKGYTFLGWSTRENQTGNPQYQAYERIKLTKTIRLYPVRYYWNTEPDLDVSNLADQLTNYSGVIFVGDSRTMMMKKTLERQYGSSVHKKVWFVDKSGEGLEWMRQYGGKLLMNELKGKTSKKSKPVAVIFNMGVNDLIHRNGKSIDYRSVVSQYTSYMNSLSKKLKKYNCKLFYMSVNPVNTAMKPTRKESEVRAFNNTLRRGLNSSFTWINSYSYFIKNGYSTHCEFRGNTDDGLHYSMITYKRIYAYVIKKLQKM